MRIGKQISVSKLTSKELRKTMTYNILMNRLMNFKYPYISYAEIPTTNVLRTNPYILEKNIEDTCYFIRNKLSFDYKPPHRTYHRDEEGYRIPDENYWYFNDQIWWRPVIVNNKIFNNEFYITYRNEIQIVNYDFCPSLSYYYGYDK